MKTKMRTMIRLILLAGLVLSSIGGSTPTEAFTIARPDPNTRPHRGPMYEFHFPELERVTRCTTCMEEYQHRMNRCFDLFEDAEPTYNPNRDEYEAVGPWVTDCAMQAGCDTNGNGRLTPTEINRCLRPDAPQNPAYLACIAQKFEDCAADAFEFLTDDCEEPDASECLQ